MRLGRDDDDRAYLRHDGKPVVAVWGIGFNDGRAYTLAECDRLSSFSRTIPRYGGNTVMLGVPTCWRTLDRDTSRIRPCTGSLLKADIVSPWTVGRYSTPAAATPTRGSERWQPDIAWCEEHGKEYLPVVFPGFSWHNMRPEIAARTRFRGSKGEFLWTQYVAAQESRRHDDLSGHVRRNGRRHGHLQMHERSAGRRKPVCHRGRTAERPLLVAAAAWAESCCGARFLRVRRSRSGNGRQFHRPPATDHGCCRQHGRNNDRVV